MHTLTVAIGSSLGTDLGIGTSKVLLEKDPGWNSRTFQVTGWEVFQKANTLATGQLP